MKRALLAVLVLALTSRASTAQPGLNLTWDDCLGAGGASDKTIACTNGGVVQKKLFLSFIASDPLPLVGAVNGQLRVRIGAASLPTWWGPGARRWGGEAGVSNCEAWFANAPNGPTALGPFVEQSEPSGLRILQTVYVGAGEEQPVAAGVEYHALVIELKFSPGTFSDVGCLTPAEFGATLLTLQQPGLPNTPILHRSTSNCATWRGGIGLDCRDPDPTLNATWGSIKALYR